jgi:hypothetical protein
LFGVLGNRKRISALLHFPNSNDLSENQPSAHSEPFVSEPVSENTIADESHTQGELDKDEDHNLLSIYVSEFPQSTKE